MTAFRYPLDEIRERCDLVEMISAHVALRKRGKNLIGLCPFHNEKTPSFTVMPERQIYKCFGCGEGGDVFAFVQKYENLTFAEAVELLARRVGVTIERSERAVRQYSERERVLHANNIACAYFRGGLEQSQAAKDYVERRGLTAATVEKYKLGFAPDSWDGLINYLGVQRVSPADAVLAGLIVPRENSTGFYDRFRGRLMFPIVDTSERIIAFGGRALGDEEPKYLNSPETPLFAKNRTLYGMNVARRAVAQQDRLIVVEGYMDVIAAQEAGFENTVATLGTALTEEHVNVIGKFTQNVCLAFDADSAGMKAALRGAPMFEQSGFGVRIISMPRGEDPDSLLRGGDVARFASLVDKALPIPDFRIKLILAERDMDSDEGKTAALREAAAVLAELESTVERERLIRLLARFHPNFSTGTTLAEDHLRQEVQAVRQRMRPQRGRTAPPQAGRPSQPPKLSLVERTERLLLGILISRNADAGKVFEQLPPKEFTGDDTRALAELLGNHFARLGKLDSGVLQNEISGTPEEALYTELLVGLDESEMNHPPEELVAVIINHHKNEQLRRKRALALKIQEGAIKEGDEEYEEWRRLVRETAGPFRR